MSGYTLHLWRGPQEPVALCRPKDAAVDGEVVVGLGSLRASELKGKHMKTFALILFFSCAGLLIISATVQILYAVF